MSDTIDKRFAQLDKDMSDQARKIINEEIYKTTSPPDTRREAVKDILKNTVAQVAAYCNSDSDVAAATIIQILKNAITEAHNNPLEWSKLNEAELIEQMKIQSGAFPTAPESVVKIEGARTTLNNLIEKIKSYSYIDLDDQVGVATAINILLEQVKMGLDPTRPFEWKQVKHEYPIGNTPESVPDTQVESTSYPTPTPITTLKLTMTELYQYIAAHQATYNNSRKELRNPDGSRVKVVIVKSENEKHFESLPVEHVMPSPDKDEVIVATDNATHKVTMDEEGNAVWADKPEPIVKHLHGADYFFSSSDGVLRPGVERSESPTDNQHTEYVADSLPWYQVSETCKWWLGTPEFIKLTMRNYLGKKKLNKLLKAVYKFERKLDRKLVKCSEPLGLKDDI